MFVPKVMYDIYCTYMPSIMKTCDFQNVYGIIDAMRVVGLIKRLPMQYPQKVPLVLVIIWANVNKYDQLGYVN